jgi:metal-responsive CopG/Arc/MetJ family transcriptional regulator
MARTKIAISLDEHTVRRLDQLVAEAVFPSRSQAIQIAIEEKLVRLREPLGPGVHETRSCLRKGAGGRGAV